MLRKFGKQPIDYLSLDVDEFQVKALDNLVRATDATGTRFRVMTVETDRYRFGDGPRAHIIQALQSRGYTLIADDVKSQGCAFETWWVDPSLVDMTIANRYRSCALEWSDILKLGAVA